MELARVLGRVVATVKADGLEGVKLLIIQPLDEHEKPVGSPLVAADALQAGIGELVSFVDGREAALALKETFVPVDACIIGQVEQLHVPEEV
ncbi:MAG: EutN/CcmL family microcompartment protein [Planctomycetota bacterium]